MGIKTPLDKISITSQDNRENIYNKLSRQSASATPSLNKGKMPQAQDSKSWIKEELIQQLGKITQNLRNMQGYSNNALISKIKKDLQQLQE